MEEKTEEVMGGGLLVHVPHDQYKNERRYKPHHQEKEEGRGIHKRKEQRRIEKGGKTCLSIRVKRYKTQQCQRGREEDIERGRGKEDRKEGRHTSARVLQ